MAISKSTPYVRYKKDFTSSLHLGTIHIESEYLDRTQKTTIESIHGMTWHNKVVNENKELNLLSDTQLELTDLEKQYWNTGEKRVSVDEIHTLEEVEPNEDGTYTYTVNSMEGEYIEIYDGINNITSTSDGLDGQFEIVYDTTEEDINGNIALDQVAPQYEIADSGVGAIIGAKSTGLTLVNHITESSKEEVVAIQEYEGQYFTIENTVQGNIKSAILKGNTEVIVGKNLFNGNLENGGYSHLTGVKEEKADTLRSVDFIKVEPSSTICCSNNGIAIATHIFEYDENKKFLKFNNATTKIDLLPSTKYVTFYGGNTDRNKMQIEYGEEPTDYEECRQTMKSVQMPVLTTNGSNLIQPFTEWSLLNGSISDYSITDKRVEISISRWNMGVAITKQLKPNTTYTVGWDEASMVTFNFSGTDKSGDMSPFRTFTTGNTGIVKFALKNSMSSGTFIIDGFRISEGNSDLGYEPYKSNILTVNEDVTLRSNGDVYDELNLLTGRLTQRIDENNEVLAQEVVKTVDLTVQNQDGGIIPCIQTQQGITHVSTSSDGLSPTVEMSCSYDTIIKPDTTYTIKLDRPIVSDTMNLQVDLGGTMMMLDADVNAFTIKTPNTLSHSQLRLSGTGNTIKEIMVLEGNRVNDKIEYFKGMKNVENPILVVSNCPYVFGKGGRK